MALDAAMNAIDTIGEVLCEQIDAAQAWREQLPDVILANAENPYGAQTLILALLIDENLKIAKKQFDVLDDVIGELHTQNVKQLQHVVKSLAGTQSLSLIDLILPTLREMTLEQYRRFAACVQKLTAADAKVNLREWIIQRMVIQHLQEQYGLRKKPRTKYYVLGSAKYPVEFMLSLLAHIEHSDETQARIAFDTAKHSISAGALSLLPKSDVSLMRLNAAMNELELLKPLLKKRFLQACVSCISHDGKISIRAYELTRTIASCLDCPLPPMFMATV